MDFSFSFLSYLCHFILSITDCMDVDVSLDEQSDLDSDDYDTRLPDQKKFRKADINSKEYMQEVYRVIINNMDAKGKLQKINRVAFETKYHKEMKGNYIRPDPYFDAWMSVLGKQRKVFKPSLLVKFYPGQ